MVFCVVFRAFGRQPKNAHAAITTALRGSSVRTLYRTAIFYEYAEKMKKLKTYFPFRYAIIFLIINGLPLNSNAQKMENTCTPTEVKTQIIINTDPATIWNILLDVKDYPSWNPYIYEIKGTIKKGSFLNFRMKKGDGERKFKAQIL
jgi:hypothetical protein